MSMVIRRLYNILFAIVFSYVCGCASSPERFVERKKVNHSVDAIIKAYERSTTGIRGRSQNGRELISKYHSLKGDVYDNAYNKKERAYSKLSILGDRRPYVLRVLYVIEERTESGSYEVVEYNEESAHRILDKMVEFLVTRPDKDDFIDDYRAF